MVHTTDESFSLDEQTVDSALVDLGQVYVFV